MEIDILKLGAETHQENVYSIDEMMEIEIAKKLRWGGLVNNTVLL